MPFAFYLASDPLTLLKRYGLLLALKVGWLLVNATDHDVIALLLPLPWGLIDGHSAVAWVPDLILTVMQLGILAGLARQALLRFAPARAASWKLDRLTQQNAGAIDGTKLGRNWVTTPLLMSGLVVLTACLIGWMVTGRGMSFESYVLYGAEAGIAVLVAVVLVVLGLMFGQHYVSAAKANVGGAFGVKYLSADHPMTVRVAALAGRLGLPAPAVGVVNVANAFAMGASKSDAAVVLGVPLVNALSREELDAVIGHELGHIASNDMQRMQFAEGFQAMLGNVLSILTALGIKIAARNRSEAALGNSLGTLARVTVFVGSELVVKGISRSREFYADAVGAALTTPEAMIGALERLHGISTTPTRMEQDYGYLMFKGAGFGMVFSTHPSLDKRVRALKRGTHINLLPKKALPAAGAA